MHRKIFAALQAEVENGYVRIAANHFTSMSSAWGTVVDKLIEKFQAANLQMVPESSKA